MPVNNPAYETVLVMVNVAMWLAFIGVFLFVTASFLTIIIRMVLRGIREELDRGVRRRDAPVDDDRD